MNWQPRTGIETPDNLKNAFYILQRYLNKDCSEDELANFSEKFFAYVDWLSQSRDEYSEDEEDDAEDEYNDDAYDDEEYDDDYDEDDDDDDDYDEDDDDEDDDYDEDNEQSHNANHMYRPGYYTLADFFESISQSDVDFNPLQRMICSHLPVYSEVFTSVYFKDEEEYTDYEKRLRYRQVISSPVFAEWIAAIQKTIMQLK